MESKMKTTNTTSALEKNTELNSLAWNDILVYDEMADQPSAHTNLLSQIKKQLAQLEEMSARRQFLTKEIMTYIVK